MTAPVGYRRVIPRWTLWYRHRQYVCQRGISSWWGRMCERVQPRTVEYWYSSAPIDRQSALRQLVVIAHSSFRCRRRCCCCWLERCCDVAFQQAVYQCKYIELWCRRAACYGGFSQLFASYSFSTDRSLPRHVTSRPARTTWPRSFRVGIIIPGRKSVDSVCRSGVALGQWRARGSRGTCWEATN